MHTAARGLLYEICFQLDTKIKIMTLLNLSNWKLLGIVHFWGKKVIFFSYGEMTVQGLVILHMMCNSTLKGSIFVSYIKYF